MQTETNKKTKIAELIKKSLFLDENRKAKLIDLLAGGGAREEEEILQTLEKGKQLLKEGFKTYLKTGGKEAKETLDRFFLKTKTVVSKGEEVREKITATKEAQDILSQINQS